MFSLGEVQLKSGPGPGSRQRLQLAGWGKGGADKRLGYFSQVDTSGARSQIRWYVYEGAGGTPNEGDALVGKTAVQCLVVAVVAT